MSKVGDGMIFFSRPHLLTQPCLCQSIFHFGATWDKTWVFFDEIMNFYAEALEKAKGNDELLFIFNEKILCQKMSW